MELKEVLGEVSMSVLFVSTDYPRVWNMFHIPCQGIICFATSLLVAWLSIRALSHRCRYLAFSCPSAPQPCILLSFAHAIQGSTTYYVPTGANITSWLSPGLPSTWNGKAHRRPQLQQLLISFCHRQWKAFFV